MAMNCNTGTMQAESKELSHLGLVATMYDELKIGETIDSFIEQGFEQRKISIGQAVKAMVVNGLGFANQRLYLFDKFFEGKDVEKLFGEGVTAADLNEHVCGRSLDTIYDVGSTEVYSVVAAVALKQLGVIARKGNIDSTSFHVDGKYECDDEPGVINITKGYSRDHRPELNQYGIELITDNMTGIPILMSALSGNDDDKTHFRSTIEKHISQLKSNVGLEYIIGDSALYTAKTIQAMQNVLWISRVPETIAPARDLIDVLADELEAESHDGAFTHRSVGSNYAGVHQHWLVVYSPQAKERAKKSVAKLCGKYSAADQKLFDKLCKQEFACREDALKALELCKKQMKISMIDDVHIEALAKFNKRGRPASNAEADYYRYQISASLASDHRLYEQRLRRKSCFIIATNQTDMTALPADQLLLEYKSQQKVERGFRFLKDPMFLSSSVFLKSPKRIMALAMVMTICLLVYAALEHRIREGLKASNQLFPNQKGVWIKRPTVRWVFQCFQNIQMLYCNFARPTVLNLKDEHSIILKSLGKSYEQIYS